MGAVKNVSITPQMISEGVRVLSDQFGVVGEHGAEEIAEELFRAMARVGEVFESNQVLGHSLGTREKP